MVIIIIIFFIPASWEYGVYPVEVAASFVGEVDMLCQNKNENPAVN